MISSTIVHGVGIYEINLWLPEEKNRAIYQIVCMASYIFNILGRIWYSICFLLGCLEVSDFYSLEISPF